MALLGGGRVIIALSEASVCRAGRGVKRENTERGLANGRSHASWPYARPCALMLRKWLAAAGRRPPGLGQALSRPIHAV